MTPSIRHTNPYAMRSPLRVHAPDPMFLRGGRTGDPPTRRGLVVWFTGLSGSGKSTIAGASCARLVEAGWPAFVLDGDDVRRGLSSDLGFSPADRKENLRRAAEVARLIGRTGVVVLAAFITPSIEDRRSIRRIVGDAGYREVYVNCPIEVCEERDVKGLYARARSGEIDHFTGVSADYDVPVRPDLELRTDTTSIDVCAARVVDMLMSAFEDAPR